LVAKLNYLFFGEFIMSFKKIIIAAFFIAVMIPNIMTAQREVKKYNYSIGASPITLAFGVLPIIYEQQIGKENTFTAQFVYSGYQGWTGLGLGASYRWYLFQEREKAIKGFGFGPLARIEYFGYENSSYSSKTSIAIGAEGSYKFIFDGGFIVEPIVQICFNVINIDGLSYRPFGIGVNVGYAWK
jgi:hypothetical protein